jgi:hypothetical protein
MFLAWQTLLRGLSNFPEINKKTRHALAVFIMRPQAATQIGADEN